MSEDLVIGTGSSGQQYASAEEPEAGSAVHLALEVLDSVDVAFGRTRIPVGAEAKRSIIQELACVEK